MKSSMEESLTPTAFIPEVDSLAKDYEKIVNGKLVILFTENILGIPITAHILGGCVMGKNANEGVIDKDNHVFGYENMWIYDGSMISANPGVNLSLTITAALAERAMSKIQSRF